MCIHSFICFLISMFVCSFIFICSFTSICTFTFYLYLTFEFVWHLTFVIPRKEPVPPTHPLTNLLPFLEFAKYNWIDNDANNDADANFCKRININFVLSTVEALKICSIGLVWEVVLEILLFLFVYNEPQVTTSWTGMFWRILNSLKDLIFFFP